MTDMRARRRRGLAIALGSALAFSCITTFASLAYQAGSTPLTVIATRSVAFVLVAALLLLREGKSPILPRRHLFASLWIAVTMTMMSVGYLSSIAYLKLGIAVILLYTFPLMVAAIGRLTGRERISYRRALWMGLAFLGLVIAMSGDVLSAGQAALGLLDIRGIVLALLAALGVAIALVFSGPVLEIVDSRLLNLWANLWMAIVVLGLAVAFDAFALPETGWGWFGYIAACSCYIVAYLGMFASLRYLPPSQVALTLNIEPVLTIGAAFLLLGESVAASQIIGTLILLIAIGFSTRPEKPA